MEGNREKLIAIIEEARREAVGTVGSMNNGFAVWYADKLLAAGVAPVQGWIPVTERLPEEWTEVLVFARCRPGADGFVQTAVYIGVPGYWRVAWNHNMLEYNIVTHWMPLPEQPGEEE